MHLLGYTRLLADAMSKTGDVAAQPIFLQKQLAVWRNWPTCQELRKCQGHQRGQDELSGWWCRGLAELTGDGEGCGVESENRGIGRRGR